MYSLWAARAAICSVQPQYRVEFPNCSSCGGAGRCDKAWLLAVSQTTLSPFYSSASNATVTITYCWETVKERCSELAIIWRPTLICFSRSQSSSRAVLKSLLDFCSSSMVLESLTWQEERQQ